MKHYVLTFVVALCGVIVAIMGWHLYTDHRLIDAIREDMVQRTIESQQHPRVTPPSLPPTN